MLCNAMSDVLLGEEREWGKEREREKEKGSSICTNIRNANQRDNSWDQLKKPDTLGETFWEHTAKLYAGASVSEEDTCEKRQRHS